MIREPRPTEGPAASEHGCKSVHMSMCWMCSLHSTPSGPGGAGRKRAPKDGVQKKAAERAHFTLQTAAMGDRSRGDAKLQKFRSDTAGTAGGEARKPDNATDRDAFFAQYVPSAPPKKGFASNVLTLLPGCLVQTPT